MFIINVFTRKQHICAHNKKMAVFCTFVNDDICLIYNLPAMYHSLRGVYTMHQCDNILPDLWTVKEKRFR